MSTQLSSSALLVELEIVVNVSGITFGVVELVVFAGVTVWVACVVKNAFLVIAVVLWLVFIAASASVTVVQNSHE